jgi:hypothetical protein
MLKAHLPNLEISCTDLDLLSSSKFALLAVGKFGLRALAQSMAKEYGPQGTSEHVLLKLGSKSANDANTLTR